MQGAGFYAQRTADSPRMRKWKYDGWPRGENSFSENNEIRDTEFYNGVNIELIGRSTVRLPRRGSRLFTSIVGRTQFNGWGIYKNPKTGANLLTVQIDGHLYKVSTGGVVTEIDPTQTWDANAKMRGVLLRDWFYFGNAVDYLAKTNGTSVVRWLSVTQVTGITLALTGTGADTLYEYGVTAVTDVGETEVSSYQQLYGPKTLDNSNYFTFSWDRKTDANVKGYNIYKSIKGSTHTLVTFIDQQTSGATMSYLDKGIDSRSLIYEAPTFNTTGGVKGNIFAKYANTLFVAGNIQEPDTVFYGGTGDKFESFSPSDNGGWVKPGRGDGDKVTDMIGFEDFLFIFKENSIWKFSFGSDGGPVLTAVIPQYGTASPDAVWRMEKDIIFLGTDARYRILGFEPTQLNVIRTTDISNRIQPKLDVLDKSNMDNFFGTFFDQKFILCNKDTAYPYDRRYLGFLGTWTNYKYDRFIVWDKGTGQQKLFGIESGTGNIQQLLVDDTYDDNGISIEASLRPKTVDGGEDTILKYFYSTKFKLKNAKGTVTFNTYKDGGILHSSDPQTFGLTDKGFEIFMWDEPMWDEGSTGNVTSNEISIVKKNIEIEAYSIYHEVSVQGNVYNHCLLQTMNGLYETEDVDYERDEKII
jgi:hypothetical protein